MWNGIPQPQMPPQQQYQQGGMAPPIPGVQNRPRLEPIDWNLVAVLNADIIRRTKDYDSLQKLVQIFMAAKLYPGSSRILAHPLCLRLCQLLQVAFEYLNYCQTELSAMNTKLEEENAKLTEKSAKLSSKLKKAEQVIKIKSLPYDRCPVCEKKFKSLDFVDRHITNRHTELADAWSIIRGRKPPKSNENDNVQKILDKIDHLKSSLKRGSGKNSNNIIEQELLATQQELMDAEQLREQQEMKQNEEIRRQLFEAADDLSSSMTLYKEQAQKKKVSKKSKPQMAIINLFDPNANINPNDYQNFPNSEPSPFNNNKEDEASKQKRINNFFNQPVNPFQKQQLRPPNDLGHGPNWESQFNNKINPFQNKANLVQLSVPIENNININNENNIINNNNEFNFDAMNDNVNNNLGFDNFETIMDTGFKNNFSIDNIIQENIQVIPQPKPNDDEPHNKFIKPIPKQAVLAAKKFISRQNDEKDKNNDCRNIKTTPEDIDKVITMIGDKVHDEIQRLGPNGIAPMMARHKYGDNDPNYIRLRKQIEQKLEMEYPMNGEVTKVKKGFDLIHTEDLTSIKNESQTKIYSIHHNDEDNDQLYSSPSKEKLIMNNINLDLLDDSQFTSAFEFNNNKNQQPPPEKKKEENTKESPDKNKIEKPEVASAIKNFDSAKVEDPDSKVNNEDDNKQDDVWSYINSSTTEKPASNLEKEETNDNHQSSQSIIKVNNRHSISFDSSSTSSRTKAKRIKNDKNDFDFIQSDMKPNFSDSPSRKTETQSPQPIQKQKQKQNNSNLLNSVSNETSGIDHSKSSLQKDLVQAPERKEENKSGVVSLEIFNSPVISHESHSRLSSKSKSSSSGKKVRLDEDEDSVDDLSDIEKMFPKSNDLSENSETELKKNVNVNSSKIEPLSEDEFNFPPVATDSFLNSSNDQQENFKAKEKEDLIRKNQNSSHSQINQSNFNSNLADKESESYKSNATSKSRQSESGSKSRMSVLSSAIRIGRADDTKAVFQNSGDETNSSQIEGKEPAISRRKPRNSPFRKVSKDSPPTKNKINVSIDDIDPLEEERQKKKKFDEYKKLADEKFRKEFDFDLDVSQNDNLNEQPIDIKNKKDDDFDEFELTGKSNESIKYEEEELDDSDAESGFMKPPPRFEFNLKAVDDDNDQPIKTTIKENTPNEKPGIKIIHKTDTKYGQNLRLINSSIIEDNNNKKDGNNDKNVEAKNTDINNDDDDMKSLQSEIRKRILKQTGITMISKSNRKYGQPRSEGDSNISKFEDEHETLDKKAKKQFDEESDKKNQLLSHSLLRNSRNLNLNQKNDSIRRENDYSDSDNKYGYVSDDEEEIKGLPRPDYFDNEVTKKNSKTNKKQQNDNSLFSSPLPPDPSISSDSVYQPENERLTFYEKKEKKKKPEKSNQSSKSKKKNETNSDLYVLTNAEPSFFHNGNHSDDF